MAAGLERHQLAEPHIDVAIAQRQRNLAPGIQWLAGCLVQWRGQIQRGADQSGAQRQYRVRIGLSRRRQRHIHAHLPGRTAMHVRAQPFHLGCTVEQFLGIQGGAKTCFEGLLRVLHQPASAQRQFAAAAFVLHAQPLGGKAGVAILGLPADLIEGQIPTRVGQLGAL